MGAPLSALHTELFSTRSRYTGASLGCQVASTGAGFAPLIFAAIYAATGSSVWLSAVIAACCVLSVVCIIAVGETREVSLAEVGAEPEPQGREGLGRR